MRHLETDASRSSRSGDKVPYFYCRGDGQLADCFAMLRIALGIDEADVPQPAALLHHLQHQLAAAA